MEINKEEYRITLTPKEQELVGFEHTKPCSDTFIVVMSDGDIRTRLGRLFIKEINESEEAYVYLKDFGLEGREDRYFDRVVRACEERIYNEKGDL